MEKLKFVVATESYIINKGLMLVINGMKNSEVVESTEEASSLKTIVAEHQPNFLIISSAIYGELNDMEINSIFQSSTETAYILATSQNSKPMVTRFKTVLNLSLGRTETMNFFNEILKQDEEEEEGNDVLSSREKTILKHVALGKSNKEISDDLFISIHTVITHRKKITAKLGIKSISGLTVYAILNGLVSMEDV